MNTLICAGGSSSRVLEALLHLCAVGHGPEKLRVLMVDPDRANGNARRVTSLVETYVTLQERLRNRLGSDPRGQPLRLFGTDLDLLGSRLQIWRPTGLEETLRQSIDHERLAGTYAIYEDVVRLLFTRASLDLEMKVGFRGRPAIGAAAMSLVSRAAAELPWSLLVKEVEGDVALRRTARVFVVGSVFGGTGAAAIHPIVRFLRRSIKAERDQLRVGVGAMVPYFTFVDQDDNTTAKSKFFPLATRSAIEFYQHLRENGDWEFDAMYWAGDSDPVKVPTCEGGDRQENPAHFCELQMALACVDFFKNDVSGGKCHYSGPRQPPFAGELADKNPADWEDMPRFGVHRGDPKRDALRMFLMAMAHRGFWADILSDDRIDQRPYCVPWYVERFGGDGSLRESDSKSLQALDAYFKDHFLRWWRETLGLERAWYFNRAVLSPSGRAEVDLRGLPNVCRPNSPSKWQNHFDEFFETMVEAAGTAGGERGLARYVALLALAAGSYLEQHYRADLEATPAST